MESIRKTKGVSAEDVKGVERLEQSGARVSLRSIPGELCGTWSLETIHKHPTTLRSAGARQDANDGTVLSAQLNKFLGKRADVFGCGADLRA